MKKTLVTSSPMRFEVVQGVFFVTTMNLFVGKDVLSSMHQGEGRNFSEAKSNFWSTWKEEYPEYCLRPRYDK